MMATNDAKRYYWLKLHKDFFKRHEITIIEDMPNGKDYILFYLKLLLESVSHEGQLRFSETIPYDEQMLASLTKTNVDIVRSAMKVFSQLEMIDVLDDRTIYMREVENLIGSETGYTIRQRLNRDRKKVSIGCQEGVNDTKSIEIRDKSIDTNYPVISNIWDKNKQCECLTKNGDVCQRKASYLINGKRYCNQHSRDVLKPAIDDANKTKHFTKPSVTEIETYAKENGYEVNAQYFFDYYEANGWKIGKNPMKDWKATVRNWSRNNKNWDSKPNRSRVPDFENPHKQEETKEPELSPEEAKEWYDNLIKELKENGTIK